MASRFWRGGSGTWDGSTTTNWSTSSGGAGGASVPTSSDDVFFDANSGSGNVLVTGALGVAACRKLNCTGFTGKFYTSGTASIAPTWDVVLGSGMQWGTSASDLGPELRFTGNTVVANFSPNGVPIWPRGDVEIIQGAQVTLTSALDVRGRLYVSGPASGAGSLFDADAFNVTALSIESTAGNRTIRMGSGTWTVNAGIWRVDSDAGFTLEAETSTLILAPGSSSDQNFYGGGRVYNNLRVTGAGSRAVQIRDGSTFNVLQIDPLAVGTRTVRFEANTTQTVSDLDAVGTAAAPIELKSMTNDTQWRISKASGTVECDWLLLRDSMAQGGAEWVPGDNSVDLANNDGWDFPLPPNAGGLLMCMGF